MNRHNEYARQQKSVNSIANLNCFNRVRLTEELYAQYYCKLVSYCKKKLHGDVGTSEECVQETFVLLLKNIDKLYAHENLPGWLFKTARNLSLKALRYMRMREQFLNIIDIAESYIPSTSNMPDYFDIGSDNVIALCETNVLSKLTTVEGEIYSLFYIQRESIQSISCRLNICESTCRVRLHRLRQKIRREAHSAIRQLTDTQA